MTSSDPLLANLFQKVDILQDERTQVMSALSKHLDPVLTHCQHMLQEPVSSVEKLQRITSVMDLCIQHCREFRRFLDSETMRNVRQRENDSLSSTASSSDPPPSYQEALLAQKQTNTYGHNQTIDMTNLAIATRENASQHPIGAISCAQQSTRYNNAVTGYRRSCLRVKFKPLRSLPHGNFLTSEEKVNQPISTFFGRWDFLEEGGWVYNEDYSYFKPLVPTKYLVRIEWTQIGEGNLHITLGTANYLSSHYIYKTVEEAQTTLPQERGKLEKLVHLNENLGIWTSIYREKDNPYAKDLTLTAIQGGYYGTLF